MGVWPKPPVPVRELVATAAGSRLEIELACPPDPRGLVFLVRGNGIIVPRGPISLLFHEAEIATATCQILSWVEREHPIVRQTIVGDRTLLSERLTALLDFARNLPEVAGLPIGLLGSGVLAGAAMETAARRPLDVDALVCRNGQLDEVSGCEYVQAATLLVCGNAPAAMLRSNQAAFDRLTCTKRFEVIREPDDSRSGEGAAALACEWFARNLGVVAA